MSDLDKLAEMVAGIAADADQMQCANVRRLVDATPELIAVAKAARLGNLAHALDALDAKLKEVLP